MLFLALAAGCGGAHDHIRAGTRIREVEPRGAPARLRAQLPPPCRTVILALGSDVQGGAHTGMDEIVSRLADALARTGAFESVRVDPTLDRAAPEAQAVLIEVTSARVEIGESDSDGSTGAVIAYLFLGIWSDWFHDRRATLECTLSITLRDARSGRVVGRLPVARGASVEDVSFWERRGGFWPVLATLCWVPPMAFDSSPERLSEILLPRAVDDTAGAVLDALAAVRVRQVRTIAFAPEPSMGIDVSLIEVKATTVTAAPRARATAGAPGAAATGPPAATVRLSGPRIAGIRRVWIGEDLAYEMPPVEPPAGRHEIVLTPDSRRLAAPGRAAILVQIGERPPVRLGELSARTEWRLGEP